MRELLDLALRAHGASRTLREVQSLDVRVSLTGALYRLKGYPEGVPNLIMRINARWRATTARELYDKMLELYPDRVNPGGALWLSARAVKG
jgi:hypothetical protein